MSETKKMNIYEIITKVKEEVGALAPTSKPGVSFPFRGIDGVVNHLDGALTKYGVVNIPRMLANETTEREDAKGRVVKTTRVEVEYEFVAPDGSSVSPVTIGLADDYADRSAAQAQSVAFRVALLQLFRLPTQSPEPEQTGQQVEDGRAQSPAPAPAKVTKTQELIDQIQGVIGNPDTPYDGEMVNALGAKISGKASPSEWMTNVNVLKKLYAALQAGETVE